MVKLLSFQKYLESLCSNICKKTLKDRFIYQWIFVNDTISEKDIESYIKSNLFAASKSLSRVIYRFEKDGINKIRTKVLLDFICDLKNFVTYFDNNQDYSWLIINTNTHITNFYYDLAQNIFWNGKPGFHDEEHRVLNTSTPFFIRQAIEYKIKRILGINLIYENGKVQRTRAKVYFDAFKKNIKYYKVCTLDIHLIEKIHNWSHNSIHGGYRPEPWIIETALYLLKDFFHSGKTKIANSHSLHAALEVYESDLEKLRLNTEKILSWEKITLR
ncbi:MAG: hypothetical protein PVH88_18490 [Ignavibacteria bacterium]